MLVPLIDITLLLDQTHINKLVVRFQYVFQEELFDSFELLQSHEADFHPDSHGVEPLYNFQIQLLLCHNPILIVILIKLKSRYIQIRVSLGHICVKVTNGCAPEAILGLELYNQELQKCFHVILVLNDKVQFSVDSLDGDTLPAVKWQVSEIFSVDRIDMLSQNPKPGGETSVNE